MYLPAIQCNNKKLNRGQLLCHDAVISIGGIFLKDRFVWCMTHEETELSVTL